MKKKISKLELFENNIIGVKIAEEKRSFTQTIGAAKVKTIRRTKYLKICWFCGSPYESNKFNSYACGTRCSINLFRQMKVGVKPPADMELFTKEKYKKEIKERFGYR